MLIVAGSAGGMTLTGRLYEPAEEPPRFSGTPDDGAPFVWLCDEFYEVASGGMAQEIGNREIRVAFEAPVPRGYASREAALEGAKEHLRTQFARVGIPSDEVSIEVRADPA